MSKLALTVVLLAIAACSGKDEWPGRGPSGAETLTIAWKAPAVGLVQTTHELSTQDLTLAAGGGPPEQIRLERRIEKRTEVLEVAATFRSKISVGYERARESQVDAAGTVERDLPVAGKRYLVWLGGGGVTATDAAGAAIGDDELEVLRDDVETELGRVPGMARLILGRTWARGETVRFGADQLAAVGADLGHGTEVRALTATWTGSDAGLARFELVVDAAGAGGMTMAMQATVTIDVDHARPVEVAGTAALSGRSDGGTITGTLTTRVVNTYVDPVR